MGISWGNIAAQGLIGGVMGGAQSYVTDIDREQKKKDELEMEERKQEMLKKRDAYLSKLRQEEHAANAQTDIKNIGTKGEAETDVLVKRRGQTDPLDIEKRGKERQQDVDIEVKNAPEVAKAKGLIAGAESSARTPAELARIQATAEEQRKSDLARAATESYTDADGNIHRKSDDSIRTTDIREGGRKLGEKPVKAREAREYEDPKERALREERNKLIEKSFRTEDEDKRLKEISRILGLTESKGGASAGPWTRFKAQ